jgi:hypothetical protein
MLDKIRSLARGELPPEYVENSEKDFDQKCAMFLGVNYELVVNYVNEGAHRPGNFAVVFRDGTPTH